MLDDRSYMRESPHRSVWSACVILMVSLVVCFALQEIARFYFRLPVSHYLALHTNGLRQGFIWQFLTFQFLHGSLWHLAGNLICLFFFGRTVEARLGTKDFLRIYFLSGFGGGILQALLQWQLPLYFGGITPTHPQASYIIGASAGVLGIIAAFALMEPEALVFLNFFIPLRAKHLLWIELGIALFYTLVPVSSGVADAAHLGGILTAMAYMRWDGRRPVVNWNLFQGRKRKRQLVQAAAQVARWRGKRDQTAAELPPEEFISKEVDPILDKISAHGIHSLTPRERQILEAARAKMGKR
jgi:membrane associated rhomboid family serine protease